MSWPTVPLSEAGVSVLDCEHRTPPAASSGHPYIAIPEIRNGIVHVDESRRISAADLANWTRRTRPQIGDIVVTRRARVGDSAPIPVSDAAIGQNLVILRASGVQVDQSYLRWAVRSPTWWDEVDRWRNVGAVFTSLNVKDIARMSIPVPALETQRAIAEVLGALDDKIQSNVVVESSSDDLCRELFKQVECRSELRRRSIGDIAEVVLGGTPSRSRADLWTGGTVPWISSGEANRARVIQPSEWITPEALQSSAAKIMPSGATVLAITGATLGQMARLEIATSGNQSLVGVWATDASLNDWVYFSLLSSVHELVKGATGAAQQHINKQTVMSHAIGVPDTEALSRFGAAVRPLLDRAATAARESVNLAALRDTLLPHLMSGRITVRDAQERVDAAL